MAGGIWEALGAALQQGSNTYRDASQQQLAQKAAAQRMLLEQQQEARQAEYQQQQMATQRDQLAMDKKQFELAQQDRTRKILEDSIEHADPNSIVDSSLLDSVRTNAPDLMTRFNVTAPKFGVNATTGLGKATADNPLGLAAESNTPAVSFTPEQATRRATLPEQAAQQQLDTTKQNTARAQKIMDGIANGTIKDTPANRALIEQYTNANPNSMWGTVEHPSRGSGNGGGKFSGLAQQVLAHPELYERLTPSARTAISVELGQAGFNFDKPMGVAGQKYMAEATAALDGAKNLQSVLAKDDGQSSGPIQGWAGYLPDLDIAQSIFGTRDVKQMQALINEQRQKIGKLFEGGVLRREDELKYEKILPTVYDSPEIQAAKMKNTLDHLNRDIAAYTEQQGIAGNRTQPNGPYFPMQQGVRPAPNAQPAPKGSRFEIVSVK